MYVNINTSDTTVCRVWHWRHDPWGPDVRPVPGGQDGAWVHTRGADDTARCAAHLHLHTALLYLPQLTGQYSTQLKSTHSKLMSTLIQLTSTHTHLMSTLIQLTSTHTHLMSTLIQLTSTHTQLMSTLIQLTSTLTQLMSTLIQLTSTRTQLMSTK